MSSINTNTSAMVALQTLKGINSGLSKTQNEISTGKTIASAKDNSAIWAISKVMESDVAGFKAISDSLALGEATVSVAMDGAQQITEILKKIKDKVISATGDNVDHAKIETEVTELTNQVNSIVKGSQFNGTNLLNTAGGDIDILSSLDRDSTDPATATSQTIKVASVNFEENLDLSDIKVGSASDATASLALIEAHLQTAVDGAAALGASVARIQNQSDFVSKVMNSMTNGIGALVDADMEEASARLQALQTQQQLGIQALSIANQQPQNILSLFK